MEDSTVSQNEEVRETSPLTDIEDIVATRPEFDDPKIWEYIQIATPWIKAQLRPDVRKELDVEYAKKYSEEIAIIRRESQTLVNEQMAQWRKDQEPLSQDEMKTLLSQEYITFPLKLQIRENKAFVEKSFTLCELPQVVEKKFATLLQSKLVTLIEEAASMEWTVNITTAKALQNILDTLPAALDTASELCALCLDPWEEDKDINAEWVAKNLSTYRIVNVLIVQSEVNRYRDFFSSGSRLFRSRKNR